MFEHGITELCRQLRKNETPAEKKLWEILKDRQFLNYKFRRQHPFVYFSVNREKRFFIADFYCAPARLILELDGKIHDFQRDYDANRDAVLAQLGLATIRIKNEELEEDLTGVFNKITGGLRRAQ
jgi:very-short-patch-repair endonuclease